MKIESLNIVKKSGSKWEYSGRFYFNSQWIPVIGKVGNYPTDSQLKKAIIRRIKSQAETYKMEHGEPQQKVLSTDDVFKEVL